VRHLGRLVGGDEASTAGSARDRATVPKHQPEEAVGRHRIEGGSHIRPIVIFVALAGLDPYQPVVLWQPKRHAQPISGHDRGGREDVDDSPLRLICLFNGFP